MTERTQRRAAERKARKSEQKKLRRLQQTAAAKAAAIEVQPLPAAQHQFLPIPATRLLKVVEAPAISQAQLAANRANAQLSHGPTTEAGKAISARNNFRHGLAQIEADPILLDSESKDDYAHLLAEYQTEWQPATPTERDLVSRLVSHQWLRRRALNLQTLFLRPEDGLILDEKQFNLYRRYEVQHERAFNKAFSDLLRLRAIRIREQNGFESQRRQNEKHEYQIRHLKHREAQQFYAKITAEARMTLAQHKLLSAGLLETRPEGLVQLS